jgi:hypothetical protein
VSGKRILHRDHESVVGQDGRYRLIRLISEDGLGQLWHGEDTPLQVPVTIRIVRESLTRDRARVDALHRHLIALYPRLAHPSIAYHYNHGQDGRVEFVVMEALRGQTLAHRLERGPEFRPREGFGIAAEIAEGLQAAHDLGFAHAALTSHSVMLNDDLSVKIMDFGLSALRPNAEERPGSEGPAEDVLALGALLREMSESRWGGRPAGDPASAKTIGAELVRVWRASMDPDPAARPTAEAFAWALREVAEPHPERHVRSVERAHTSLRLDDAERRPEEVRQAEVRQAGEVRQAEVRQAEERQAEERQAEEVRRAEEVRQAEERQAEEVRQAEERQAEVRRAEVRRAEVRRAEVRRADERRAFLEAEAAEARRAVEVQRKAEETRKGEKRRALLETQATEARDRAEVARGEEKAASAEVTRRAKEVAQAKEALGREESRSTEAGKRSQDAKARSQKAMKAQEVAEAEHARLSQEVAKAEDLARQEENLRTETVRRAENAARQAETARASAAATRARKTKADEEARSAGEAAQAEEARSAEARQRLATAARQLNAARMESEAARAEHARRVDLARRADETARKKDQQAKEASGRAEGVPGNDASNTPRRSLGDASPSAALFGARPGSDAPPKRAERSWSAVGLLPRGRRWLWLAGLVLVTAFLVFLLARPDAERAGNPTPPTAPQSETGSPGIVMPDLRGLSYAEALSRLQDEGLGLARRVEAQGDPGIVVATDPSLGHLVPTETRVTIFVGAA